MLWWRLIGIIVLASINRILLLAVILLAIALRRRSKGVLRRRLVRIVAPELVVIRGGLLLAIALIARSTRMWRRRLRPALNGRQISLAISCDSPLHHHGPGHLDLWMDLRCASNYRARIRMDLWMFDYSGFHSFVRPDSNGLPRYGLRGAEGFR